jgi:CheY-like chemotaxis protein
VPHTLLLADDSVTIQRVIELTFADEDVRVVAVSDGDQAIARLDEQPPDIVLADVGMPGRNGYEVASYVKSQPRLAHIPVLLLTGAFEPIDQGKADAAGCDGVLAKPFEPQIVISRVKELLARARGGPAPPVPSGRAPALPGVLTPARPAATRAASGETAVTPHSLVDYFDELDAAFAKLPGARAEVPATHDEFLPDRLPSPAAPAPPVPAFVPAAKQTLPALAEAFAALLAAEQNTPPSSGTAPWPPPPAITDELVERVARRVLEMLSDRIVRETVADLVSTIAERLVREEIERIKGAIK